MGHAVQSFFHQGLQPLGRAIEAVLLNRIGSPQLGINAHRFAEYLGIARGIFDVVSDLECLANTGTQIDPGARVYAG